MSRRPAYAALVAVVAVIVAGCGGSDSGGSSSSDTTAASTWADGLCSAITTWQSALSGVAGSLTSGDLNMDALSSAVDDANAATSTFASDVRSLGTPDTEAGRQAKDAADQLATEIEADMKKIDETVSGASGITGVIKAVPTLTKTLQSAGSQVSSTIKTLRALDAGGELQKAFEDAPSCSTLTGSN